MRGRTFDARHLDVAAFAERGAELAGEFPVADLARLAESAHAESPPAPHETVSWDARGERLRGPGGDSQDWLHLRAHAPLRLTCQRCLRPVEYQLEVDNSFRFVADEATAAALDVDAEEDLLVQTRSFDLPALIEEELLLALPLVPRHEETCPQPLRAPPDPVEAAIAANPRAKPFASLAGLKVRKTSG